MDKSTLSIINVKIFYENKKNIKIYAKKAILKLYKNIRLKKNYISEYIK